MPTARSAETREKIVAVEEVKKAADVEEVTWVESESIPVTKVSLIEDLGLSAADMLLLSQDSLTVYDSKTAFYDTLKNKGMLIMSAIAYYLYYNGSSTRI